ncbi:MAG: hypothetical protein Q9167_007923, partial [Letrouitia subvulpina]
GATPSSKTAATSDPKTPSQESGSELALKSHPTNPVPIGQAMTQHGLLFRDLDAFKLAKVDAGTPHEQSFKELVLQIINGERHSAMKDRSVERFVKQKTYYERRDEASFLHNLLSLIIKPTFTPDQRSQHEQEMLDRYGHLDKEWFDEGVAVLRDVELKKTLLPNRYRQLGFEQRMAVELAKADGMTNARPDYTYGIRTDLFRAPADYVRDWQVQELLDVAPGCFHPFLIGEGKADRGSAAEAENQAR